MTSTARAQRPRIFGEDMDLSSAFTPRTGRYDRDPPTLRNVRPRLCTSLPQDIPRRVSPVPILRKEGQARYSKKTWLPRVSPAFREEVECYYGTSEDISTHSTESDNKGNLFVVIEPTGSSEPASPIIDQRITESREGIQRIHFSHRVAVHRIPGRDVYSDDVRRSMWHGTRELSRMAHRNTIEFASDGYDWRRAAEDEDMYKLPTGELIHPVWEQYWHFRPIKSEPLKNSTGGMAA